jgi:Flp pilus assembly protein TadD
LISRLATDNDPEVAEAAKEVYNPYEHFGAPASVLNELGSAAMKKDDFDGAVRFFELARKKDPDNPMILNNLSYSWLRSNDQDANRALQLVDQGLRLISGNNRWGRYRSNFLDTRGTALVRLERYEEAIAAFEKALTTRPNDIGLLTQLTECYEKAGLDTSVLINRINRLKESGSQ